MPDAQKMSMHDAQKNSVRKNLCESNRLEAQYGLIDPADNGGVVVWEDRFVIWVYGHRLEPHRIRPISFISCVPLAIINHIARVGYEAFVISIHNDDAFRRGYSVHRITLNL